MAEQTDNLQSEENTEQRISKFLQKGEEMMDTFHESVRAFEAQSLQIKSLQQSVEKLQHNSSTKRKFVEDNEQSTSKRRSSQSPSVGNNVSNSDVSNSDVEDDLDDLLSSSKQSEDSEFLGDLTNFFEEEVLVGEDIADQLGSIVNRSLHGHSDKDKIKTLKEKYKRPGNVVNLQVPKVDKIVWDQLKGGVKKADFLQQKALSRTKEGILPLIRAMDHLTTTKSPDVNVLKTAITDAFKLLCNSFTEINNERRMAIKKELHYKYHSICDNPTSATGLFGDTLAEDLKKLDTKQIDITATSTSQNFLDQSVGVNTQRRKYSHQNFQNKNKFQTQSFYKKQSVYKRSRQRNKSNNKGKNRY